VRRAIAYAIDRESLVDAVLFGNGETADSLLSPGTPYYDGDTGAPELDLDKAKEELAQSSMPDGFSTELLIRSGDPNQTSVAQILQSELAELGITVEITHPDQWTSFAVDPEGGSHSAFTYYDDPEVVALNKQAQLETDDAKRADLYTQLQEKTGESAFLAYLYYSPYAYAVSDRIDGFAVTPLGNYHLEDVTKAS
jgi:peptide/nickel transport system substrate-binding protein